jgi:hypothetical protein
MVDRRGGYRKREKRQSGQQSKSKEVFHEAVCSLFVESGIIV